jgi:peroxiredoxin (alkyl hydroperoxide reductase subunit C)
MGEKIEVGCARPIGGPVESSSDEDKQTKEKETIKMSVQVGKKAPDFQAPAFHEGIIKQIKLFEFFIIGGNCRQLCRSNKGKIPGVETEQYPFTQIIGKFDLFDLQS